MNIRKIKCEAIINEDVVDFDTLRGFGSGDAYISYIKESIFWVDHHDIFRSVIGGWGIATTKEQLAALIEYLQVEVMPVMDSGLG